MTLVLPCLNEEAGVGPCVEETLEETLTAFDAAGIRGEVIVVDNGSADESAAVARAAGARVIPEDPSPTVRGRDVG